LSECFYDDTKFLLAHTFRQISATRYV